MHIQDTDQEEENEEEDEGKEEDEKKKEEIETINYRTLSSRVPFDGKRVASWFKNGHKPCSAHVIIIFTAPIITIPAWSFNENEMREHVVAMRWNRDKCQVRSILEEVLARI